MKRLDVFINGIKKERWRWATWRVSIFAVTRQAGGEKPEPYDIDYKKEGTFYYSEDGSWEPISGVEPMTPVFSNREFAVFPAELSANQPKEIRTTYGRMLFNVTVLANAFGHRVPFTESQDVMDITKLVTPLVKPLGEGDPAINIYPTQLPVYVQSLHELINLCPIISPTGTERSMETHPEMAATRKRLYEENKDNLDDPAVVAKIEGELIKLDKEFQGQDETKDFYLSGKDYSVKRKKLFLSSGMEKAFREDGGHDIIQQPLSDGWDMDNIPAIVNSIREGSYDRGADTALGGEKVTFLQRVTQNSKTTKGDCGTPLSHAVLIDKATGHIYKGLNHMVGGKPVHITKEVIEESMGKVLKVRRPILCKRPSPDYCEVCMGEELARNERAIASEVSAMASTIMYAFMKSMHGKELSTAEYEIDMIK